MKEQSTASLLSATIEKIRNLVDVSTIIGEPIQTGEVTIIPVSKVTYGFCGGGSDLPSKNNAELFGGAAGAGITISPICFLVIKGGEVSIKHISTQEGSVERVIGMVPDMVDKVTGVVNSFLHKQDDDADFVEAFDAE